jgi:hypothetical protein
LHAGCAELEEPRMGLAAGGQISQKIYEDMHPVSLYDEEASERLWVHTVTSAIWEVRLHTFTEYPEPIAISWQMITGTVPPLSPIVPGSK